MNWLQDINRSDPLMEVNGMLTVYPSKFKGSTESTVAGETYNYMYDITCCLGNTTVEKTTFLLVHFQTLGMVQQIAKVLQQAS